MKTLRFIKKLLCGVGKLTLCILLVALVEVIFIGFLWCIGWIAHSLGMPAPQGDAVKDMPEIGCGVTILIFVVVIAFIINGVILAWRWLRNLWQSC